MHGSYGFTKNRVLFKSVLKIQYFSLRTPTFATITKAVVIEGFTEILKMSFREEGQRLLQHRMKIFPLRPGEDIWIKARFFEILKCRGRHPDNWAATGLRLQRIEKRGAELPASGAALRLGIYDMIMGNSERMILCHREFKIAPCVREEIKIAPCIRDFCREIALAKFGLLLRREIVSSSDYEIGGFL
jgi:hypothetical protein